MLPATGSLPAPFATARDHDGPSAAINPVEGKNVPVLRFQLQVIVA
jgi:hypothetical protein